MKIFKSKKLFTVTLSLLLILAMSACGTAGTSPESSSSADAASADAGRSAAAERAAAVRDAQAENTEKPEESAGESQESEGSADAAGEASPVWMEHRSAAFHEKLEALRAELPPLPDLDIHSWEFLIANSYNSIKDYTPPYGNIYGQGIDRRIADPVVAFLSAARDAGYDVHILAGTRNSDYQFTKFTNKVAEAGSAWEVSKTLPAPGTSEHQTGLCIDVTDNINYAGQYEEIDDSAFRNTEAYKWLCEHCTEYGFIVRYPEGKEDFYGCPCRNGHFRYVGTEAARYITENNLCLEEFVGLYDEEAVYVPDNPQ